MAGPLHWFRKNQKVMLGVFGVGLMFVFTISLGSGVDPLVDRLTGAGPTRSQDSVAVQWDGGELLENQLEQLRIGRNLLRRFLLTVRQIAADRGGVQRVTMLPLYTGDRSLLELELLAAEADKLGIAVGDEAVLDYLDQLSAETVSASEYGRLLRTSTGSNLSEAQLLDLMARELKAQKVRAMVQSGGFPASPIAAWDYYNRLNRFVKAEMMPISVDDFLDEVDDPSEAEIVEMYEKYKDKYPFPLSPEPGFRRREQRAFQYVKVNYDAILEVEKAAVTDEEVARYYEENKEQYRKDLPSDLDLEVDDPSPPAADEAAEGVDTSAAEEADASPADETTSDPAASATEKAPAADADEAADATAAEATDPPDAAAADAEETPPPDAPTETETPEINSDPDPSPTALPQEDDADPPREGADDEQPAATESAAETAAEQEQTDADAPSPDTATTDVDTAVPAVEAATDVDEQPAVKASDDAAAETAGASAEEKEESGAETTTVEPSDLDPVVSDEPLYEALADVADDIHQTIARPRAQAKMNSIINQVKRELGRYHDAYTIWDIELESDPDAEKPGPPDFGAFADGDQVVVGDIPLIDPLQAEDFEIGRAFDLRFPQGGVQRVMFADTAFSEKTSLFSPQVIPDIDVATNRFVYWMTDVQAEYIPELDQVRTEVVQALKRQRALNLALEDAEKLAEKASNQNAKLSESLSDRENAEFIDTGEISWVTPPLMEGSTPRISVIPGAEDASPELRETLFRLEQGEVGYAANMPKSKVYVFRVEEVNPTTELRREQFLRSGVDAPVLFLARRDSLVGLSEWYRDLSDRYNVQWKRDPRAGEGERL